MAHEKSVRRNEPTRPTAPSPGWDPERILFEDEWLIVVDKPAGVPTQPTLDARRPSVQSMLGTFLRERDGGEPYLGLQHRLDRDTSGVLLFTRDPRANAGVTALFAGKAVRKTYLAIAVSGAGAPDSWEVSNHLAVIGRVGKASRFGAVRSGGDAARTTFRVVERLSGAILVEASPQTGRTHQIRVHLAEGGYPILGDPLYGGPTHLRAGGNGGVVQAPRVMLHAAGIAFVHPITQASLQVTCSQPEDLVQCLGSLRCGASSRP